MKAEYTDGTMAFPVRCADWSEACDCAGERGRPTVCAVPDEGRVAIAKVYPSRDYRILRYEAAKEQQ